MNTLTRKEIRLITPAWILALTLGIVPFLLWKISGVDTHSWPEGSLFAPFGAGILILALATFGQEFGNSTFASLLTQPVPRSLFWRIKLRLLLVSMLSVTVIFLICVWSLPRNNHDLSETDFRLYSTLFCGTILLCALSGGLWTTLIVRQIAAAFWVSLLAPFVICISGLLMIPETWSFQSIAQTMCAVLIIYAVAGILFARRAFLRAQDLQWTGGTIPSPFRSRTKMFNGSRALTQKKTPLRALIWKEIQMQHVSLWLAAVTFILHIVIMIVRRVAPNSVEAAKALLAIWFILWFAQPFLTGSLAVAEERRLGTFENHLCLPITRRTQFWTKFLVAIALSSAIFVGIPWLIGNSGLLAGVRSNPIDEFFASKDPRVLSALAAGVTALSFYASTLTRNTLQAIGTAIFVNITVGWIMLTTATPRIVWNGPRIVPSLLFVYTGLPILLVALLWLGVVNYKRVLVDIRLWRRNALVLAGAFAFAWIMTILVYNRSWELLMNLEPAHGPARLSGSVTPKIHYGMPIYLELPDGRWWVTTTYRHEFLFKSRNSPTNDVPWESPTAGQFIDKPSAAQINNGMLLSFPQSTKLNSDGTLTENQPSLKSATNKPRRLSNYTDWIAVTSWGSLTTALAADGTLTCWQNTSMRNEDSPDLLGPSRKPLWSLNIFAATK